MAKYVGGRERRKRRVRKKVYGTADRPRMSVFRSAKHISVQLVDDDVGKTITAASTYEGTFKGDKNSRNAGGAKLIGEEIAKRALEKGVKVVVFDRGGYNYHGRVKALADAARQKGLKF